MLLPLLIVLKPLKHIVLFKTSLALYEELFGYLLRNIFNCNRTKSKNHCNDGIICDRHNNRVDNHKDL